MACIAPAVVAAVAADTALAVAAAFPSAAPAAAATGLASPPIVAIQQGPPRRDQWQGPKKGHHRGIGRAI